MSQGAEPVFDLLTVIGLALSGHVVDCPRISDAARVEAIGKLSDMRYTEEHAYGHILQLWRSGACVFGLLEVAEGLAGDTPAGELTDVRYDPQTGELKFSAKLTTGMAWDKNLNTWVPSRELFVFAGRLKGKVLKGKLLRSDQLRPAADLHGRTQDLWGVAEGNRVDPPISRPEVVIGRQLLAEGCH